MKALILMACLCTNVAFARDLVDCTVFNKDGQVVKEVERFDIAKIETNGPEATVDGGLADYSNDGTSVFMFFSNECDNGYELHFSSRDLKAAVAGEIDKVEAHANIYFAGFGEDGEDFQVDGKISCHVR